MLVPNFCEKLPNCQVISYSPINRHSSPLWIELLADFKNLQVGEKFGESYELRWT